MRDQIEQPTISIGGHRASKVLTADVRAVFSGHRRDRPLGIGPRQQVVELAIRVAVDDPGDDVRPGRPWARPH